MDGETMIESQKIVSIGSGSASFYLSTLGDIFRQKLLENAEICMVDTNELLLNKVAALGHRLNHEMSANISIVSNSDRKKVLHDANFVILTIAVDREQTWKDDIEIAQKHGIWHYGENGGPGAFGHTARNIATLRPILEDIKDLAPQSTVINFTNPLPRIHQAITSLTNLKCISYCHQYFHGYYLLGKLLSEDLINHGQQFSKSDYKSIRNAALDEYNILAAGINHFTWMLEVSRKRKKENLYPLLSKSIHKAPVDFEKLSRKIFRVFGYFPVPGETHVSEYLPYTKNERDWNQYNLYHFNFNDAREDRKRNLTRLNDIISGRQSVESLNYDVAERIAVIMAKLCGDTISYEPALNIENKGSISNLPDDAIIEVPCKVNKKGVVPEKIGNLPDSIATLCNREITIAKLIVEGSIKGDRDLIIQAFALDPMVANLDHAEVLSNDYITTFKNYLPQFL
jgi:alpha-galactosidase